MAANERESDPELSADDSDISAELQPERPPPKKKKFKGAATYKCKFSSEWTKTVGSFIVKGDNVHSFRCTICNRTISCRHMGLADVQRHVKLDMHTQNAAAMRRQPTLQHFRRTDPLTEKVC